MGVKELKEVLAKGKVFNDVLKDHKTGGACRYKGKSKAPDIPLDTNLGVGDLTLEALMKREGISYKEAVSVYLAFEDALKQPKSAKNKPKAPANPPPTDVEPEEAMPSKKAKACKVAPKARASREKSKPEKPAAGLKRKGASSDLGACEEPPAVRVRSKSSGQRPAKEPKSVPVVDPNAGVPEAEVLEDGEPCEFEVPEDDYAIFLDSLASSKYPEVLDDWCWDYPDIYWDWHCFRNMPAEKHGNEKPATAEKHANEKPANEPCHALGLTEVAVAGEAPGDRATDTQTTLVVDTAPANPHAGNPGLSHAALAEEDSQVCLGYNLASAHSYLASCPSTSPSR